MSALTKYWSQNGIYLGKFIEEKDTLKIFEHGSVKGIVQEVPRKYTWAEIEETVTNGCSEYRNALEYVRECYDEKEFYTEDDMRFILNEIKDEAESKIQLRANSMLSQDLRDCWPNFDSVVNSIIKKGTYP
jgi:hypothetical protein